MLQVYIFKFIHTIFSEYITIYICYSIEDKTVQMFETFSTDNNTKKISINQKLVQNIFCQKNISLQNDYLYLKL